MKKSTVDSISSLPDAILCRILSFATTKEAVATSILSKRWINLWHHVPILNFPYINVDTVISNLLFNEFVYSVLLSKEANVIDGFVLNIHYGNTLLAKLGFPNTTKWVNHVVQRKLKYLHLHLNVYPFDDFGELDAYIPKLPVSIFTCTTLVSLNLRRFRVDEGFTFTGFPSLKLLYLESVNFSKVQDFMMFIAGCPILEDVEIIEMNFLPLVEDSLTLQEFKRLCLPNLKRAKFVEFHCHCFPVNALSTAKYLCIYTFKVLNIIKYLYTVDPRMYKVNQLQHPYDVVPVFHNLTHLELYNRWDLVVQVLHQCPKLQNLMLAEGLCDSMRSESHQKNWVEPEFVPPCLLSSLRTFTIRNYSPLPSEFMLEQYILKNARILQTMTIWCMTKQPEMERILSMCPMASATCQLLLSSSNI